MVDLLTCYKVDIFFKHYDFVVNQSNLVDIFVCLCKYSDLSKFYVDLLVFHAKITKKLFGSIKAVKSLISKELYERLDKMGKQVE